MRKHHILLVDDDPFILTGIGKDLSGEGYAVTTADNGEQAIELINRTRFDLVITDLVMDRIDGIQVLKAAKTRVSETMVLILTGYGDMGSAIDALRLDADDDMLKPCEPDEMRFRVSRCFERLELARKLNLYEKMLPICCVCKKIRDDGGPPHAGQRAKRYRERFVGVPFPANALPSSTRRSITDCPSLPTAIGVYRCRCTSQSYGRRWLPFAPSSAH
jgi:CheY-like chemotaxis protein